METINTELILADLETLDRAIPRFEKEVKGKKLDPSVLAAAKEAQELLQKGTPLSAASVDLEPVKELGLLTAKPFIYVFNVDEAVLTDAARKAELAALVAPAEAVFLDAKIESELIDLDPADAAELLASTGQEESGLDQLARVGFDTLGLQTYLTAGPKESRAWTIHQGWKAPQAAGVIHTDFERGFIKAEVISLRRPRRHRLGRRGARQGQGPHGGQGLRHAGRRRRGVPLQRLSQRPWRFLYGFGFPFTMGARPLPFEAFALPPAFATGFSTGAGAAAISLLASSRKRIPTLVSRVSPCRVKSGCPTSVSSFSIDE